ncbi:MAG: BrnT family toxin [Bdellovibrio sp.]|nr:BrnT family toxin [Bdellovibrio sp.]
MAQFRFLLWLAYWYQQNEAFEFEWDIGNSQKSSKKHDVGLDEIESVFEMKMAVPLGRQVTPVVDEERLCLIGPTEMGRMLSVVFTLRDGRVRPISGRAASKKERALYEEISKTIKNL